MAQQLNKLTITIATGLFPPDIGGPATFAVRAQKDWTDAGHTVRVLPFSAVRKYPKVIRHLLYTLKLLKHARTSHVVIVLDPVSVGVPAYIASFFTRTPFVLRLVGDYAWEQYVQHQHRDDFIPRDAFETATIPRKFSIIRAIQQVVAKRMRAIIVPSEYLKSVTQLWGVEQRRIHVVYNMITPLATSVRKQSYQASAPFRFLSIGRLVPWKGFRCLIEVLANVPNATLTIVGSGPDDALLTATAREHHVLDRVTLERSWSRETLINNMASFDCLLFNTAYEGFSHVLIEAMAVGLPIVTTATGGNAEIVINNDNALVAPFNQQSDWQKAMALIQSNQSLREQLGASAQTTASAFEGGDMTQRYLEILTNLL